MVRKSNQMIPPNEIIFYETEDGKISIAVRFEHENIWLTKKHIAELFECSTDNVSLHLKNIYAEGELAKDSTTEESSVVQQEGVRSVTRKTVFYNLEAVIAVGYRVNTGRGIAFRAWATDKLKNYIFKGFSIDSERFKKGSKFDTRFFDELLEEIREIRASERMAYQKITDIYATAVDYSPNAAVSSDFFATVQNKLHFAITGHTAAEIIKTRVDGNKPNMGLTTWRKAPGGKIYPSDIVVAKNYLSKEEIESLNKIVSMYIDYAEFQAARRKVVTMRQWVDKLNAFLKFNEQDILEGFGKISREVAISLAQQEYEKYRAVQDAGYESDFDKLVEKTKNIKSEEDDQL